MADDFAALLHHLITQPLSPNLRSIICAARLVGIPKDGGGVRPIAVSSIFLKLIGTICMKREAKPTCAHQYAIAQRDGASRILHEIAAGRTSDSIIVKFDIVNAFNAMSRDVVNTVIKNHDQGIQQYFRLVYGVSTPLCVYGPDEHVVIDMPNGIRQGDSTSTYLFAHCVDTALLQIARVTPSWMYVDDLTICTTKAQLQSVLGVVHDAFASIGLKLNPAKTRIFASGVGSLLEGVPTSTYGKEIFKLLGADLSETREFEEEQIRKQKNYFQLLNSIASKLHPQQTR